MKIYLLNYYFFLALILIIFFLPLISLAASLSISPSTGVYSAGTSFVARAVVNTNGASINAAEGTIKFNPQEVTVVSIDRSSSIFNLWVTEPSYSNIAGTISFSGGLPTGYTGSAGTLFNITFRTTNASTARVSFTNGSVLANDGRGTNVLSNMSGGTFTIQAPSSLPTPEIIEYVAPANTPSAPKLNSTSHPDSTAWYQSKEAKLNWELPSGVVAIRTLLDTSATSIPTKVYDTPIKNIVLNDLPEGVSYFHIQFKNSEGWGKVTHYRLAVDSQNPTDFKISFLENYDLSNPSQTLSLEAIDETSGVNTYKIKIDNLEASDYVDEKDTKLVTLPILLPGYHSVIIEAYDRAGNSIIGSFSFTISAFDRPVFTEYPSEINEEVIPVIRGTTRPNSKVEVLVRKVGTEPAIYDLLANSDGVFTLIPEGTFTRGVYEISARSTDEFGAQSEVSEIIRIAVQQPGYVQIGIFLINILSVIVPLFAMSVLLIIASWFLVLYLRRFKKRVSIESKEAVAILDREFKILYQTIEQQKIEMASLKKANKLTKAEEDMFNVVENSLKLAQTKVEKEVTDVEKLVQRKQ